MIQTTTEDVSLSQLEQLRTEAGQAGELEQVALCELALRHLEAGARGGQDALAKCVAAINAALALIPGTPEHTSGPRGNRTRRDSRAVEDSHCAAHTCANA